MKNCPCHKCEERKPHCHGSCQLYAEYHADRALLSRLRAAESSAAALIVERQRKRETRSYYR